MKKVLLSSIILMFSLISYSQNINYPIFQYDSAHNKIAVIISIKQAQKIENDYDILELLGKSKSSCDTLVRDFQIVIKDKNNIIATQGVKINGLERIGATNDSIIANLNAQISKYIEDQMKCNQLVSNKDKEITILHREVNKQKIQKIAGFSIFGVAGGGVVAILVYGIVKGFITIK